MSKNITNINIQIIGTIKELIGKSEVKWFKEELEILCRKYCLEIKEVTNE